MILDIDNSQNIVEFTQDIEDFIRECVLKTIEFESIIVSLEISICLTDNENIQGLNRKYRGIDTPTDVLSFPLLDQDEEFELFPGEEVVAIGDIIISLEKTKQQAEEYGHSFLMELGFLTIHGMLHLLGYDHESGEYEPIMREKEAYIMQSLGLSREERFHE